MPSPRSVPLPPRPRRVAARSSVVVGALALGSVSAALLPAPSAWAQGGSTSTAKASSTTAKATSTTVRSSSSSTARASSTATASTVTPSTAAGTSTPVTTPPLTGSLPFPARVVAPVVTATTERERAVSGLWVTPGAATNSTMAVVKFKDPFDLPRKQYRISVVMGKPDGDRVRSSLTTNGGPKPEGKVEKWDGAEYKWISTAEVAFDASGQAALSVPTDIAPSGAVWAEVEVGGGGGEVTTTPYFPQDALFGRVVDGTLAASTYGRLVRADGTVDPDPITLEGGPLLSAVNQGATLTSATRAPTEVAGQPVTHAVDIVLLSEDFSRGGVAADEIRVDRTEGTVRLVQRSTQPPVDKSDAPAWLVDGLPADDPAAPARLTFSLPDAAAALGIELGPDAALGLRREFTLEDGSTVIADASLATTAWFDAGASAAAAATETSPPTPAPKRPLLTADDGAADQQRTVLLAIGAGVGVLVLLSLVVMLRRRRLTAPARRAASAARPRAPAKAPRRRRKGDAADLLQDMAEDMDEMRRTGQLAVVTGVSPQADDAPAATATAAPPTPTTGRGGTDRGAEAFAPVTGQQPVVVLTGEVPAVVAEVPAVVAEVPPPADGPPALVTLDDIQAGRVPVPDADDAATLAATVDAATPDEAGERARPPRPRRAPADPLGLLDDVSDLTARLERLGPAEPGAERDAQPPR